MKPKFTLDTFKSKCVCGESIYLTRRNQIALIPNGHKCQGKDNQDAVLRTIKAEESIGLNISPKEVDKRLRDFGLSSALRPA